MKRSILIMVAIASSILYVSCEHFVIGEADSQKSSHNDNESHYTGENCLRCHYPAGTAEGFHSLAGTVYGNFSNATVYLHTDVMGGGEIQHRIEVDALGNFYTTEDINFEQDLYAVLEESDGTRHFMIEPLINGQCNLCHGYTEDKLEIN